LCVECWRSSLCSNSCLRAGVSTDTGGSSVFDPLFAFTLQQVTSHDYQSTCVSVSDVPNIRYCFYKHTKFGANRSRIGWDIPFCAFFKMAAAAVLNVQKLCYFLTPDDTYVAHIYHHIKFGANWSKAGLDMFFCVFSKMVADIQPFFTIRFWCCSDQCWLEPNIATGYFT